MKQREPQSDFVPSADYPGYAERREGDYRVLRQQITTRSGHVKLGLEMRIYDPLPWDMKKPS